MTASISDLFKKRDWRLDKWFGLISLVVVLMVINVGIYTKEQLLTEGRIVYLKLVPVDPRSLMQGDYMALRFEIERDLYRHLPKKEKGHWRGREVEADDGLLVVNLAPNGIASFDSLYVDQPLTPEQQLLKYRIRNDKIKFATNAFFFEEGSAEAYEVAKYGQFRVDEHGDLLLVAMFDQELNKIEPVKD